MTNGVRQRQDVPPEDTWNLRALCADDAAWEADYRAAQELPERVEAYRGGLAESDELLAEALRAWFDANRQMETVWV
ncbi:MAG TPA: oligoendopeptidase F, partial [Anaerolineae bacterium]|nr:oligoendopeptidase F [Anaerolineae bacterium]